jgi:hypothetical protein
LSLWDTGARIVAHSFAGDQWEAIAPHVGIDVSRETEMTREERQAFAAQRRAARDAVARDAAKKREFARDLWDGGRPLTLADTQYLAARGLQPSPHLRNMRVGVIMAAVVSPQDDFMGIHRTYHDKVRAYDRKMLGRQAGGCIRLTDPARTLAIAEGIETALSFTALHGVPCWSARSANGLEQWRPPIGTERVIIAADGDEAGMKAARTLEALLRSFVRVEVAAAPEGQDWNDVLRGKRNG